MSKHDPGGAAGEPESGEGDDPGELDSSDAGQPRMFPSLGDLPLPDLGELGRLGGLGGSAPLGGLSGLFDRAREQLEEASEEAGHVVVTGRAGGGSVEVDMNGNLEVLAVRIAREAVDQGDVGLLEDLVLAAVRQAVAEATEVREQAASSLVPQGMDLGSLVGGLFSGGMPEAFGSFMDEMFGEGTVADAEPEAADHDQADDDPEDRDPEESEGEHGTGRHGASGAPPARP